MLNLSFSTQAQIRILFLLIYSALTFIYMDYLKSDGLINRDDTLMVEPLLKIQSIGEYVQAVSENKILDVQPIRDLTFIINFKIYDWFGVSTFHFLNLLLFFIAIYLLNKLLFLLNFSPALVIFGTLLFSAHPLLVSAVGWVSSRKHTLALIFALITIYNFLKHKDLNWKAIISFFISSMSHQIFFLLPIWIWTYAKTKKWKLSTKRLAIMCILSWSFVVLAAYKTFYINVGEVYYSDSAHLFENISRYILSVGRSFILIIMPFSISTLYSQGSVWNIIGLPLLVIFIYIFYKSKHKQDTLLWVFLAILVHIPTYIAFINDTYLYLGLICFIVCFLYILQALEQNLSSKALTSVKVIIISLLSIKTYDASPMWKSMDQLWKYSYTNEPSAATGMYFSQYLKEEKDQIELLHWSGQSFNFRGNLPMIDFFVTKIYVSSIPASEKIKIFEDCYFDHPLYKAYYGLMLLEGDNSQMNKGIEILSPILKHDHKYFYKKSKMTIIKAIKYVCQNFKGKEIACHQLEIEY